MADTELDVREMRKPDKHPTGLADPDQQARESFCATRLVGSVKNAPA